MIQVLSLGLVLMVSGIAAAQEPAETPTEEEQTQAEETKESKEGERVFRDQIVVTASRREQESADTPVPITVITREEIERRQPEKMVDLFKQVPGVEVTGEGPFRGAPVIRGLSSNRVLILVDGERLNNSRESTVFAGIQPGLVDLAQVERIEVLRGPASVQYGSDALGGVINIITRQPDLGTEAWDWSGDVGLEYGENADARRANAQIAGTGNRFSLRLGAGYEKVDDYKAPSDAADDPRFSRYVFEDGTVPNSGMKQYSVSGNLRWLLGESSTFKVNLESVRTDDIGFPGYDPETSGIDIAFPRFDRDKVNAIWETGPLGGLEGIKVSAYYQMVVKESIRNFDVPGFFQHNFTRSDIDSFGLNLQSGALLGAHHLTFGLDFYRDDLEDQTVLETPWSVSNEVAVPRSHQQGYGLWAQDDWDVSDKVKLVFGVRGDQFDFRSKEDPNYFGDPFDETDSALSGNVGVVWGLTNAVDLTMAIGRGFRSPNLAERSYFGPATEPGYFILQNPDLSSERSLNYEAGFKVRYDRYYGGFTVFYNDVTDLITFVDAGEDPDTGTQYLIYDNVAESSIQGAELELETIFLSNWTMFSTIAYTRGDNKVTDQPLAFIPPLKVVLGLRYQTGRWWAEGAARIVDRQDRLPEGYDESPGFTTYDVRGGYDFRAGLSVQATLENLSDKLFAEPFNNRPEPGRNLRMSVRYRF